MWIPIPEPTGIPVLLLLTLAVGRSMRRYGNISCMS
jgi:hypothetical protein